MTDLVAPMTSEDALKATIRTIVAEEFATLASDVVRKPDLEEYARQRQVVFDHFGATLDNMNKKLDDLGKKSEASQSELKGLAGHIQQLDPRIASVEGTLRNYGEVTNARNREIERMHERQDGSSEEIKAIKGWQKEKDDTDRDWEARFKLMAITMYGDKEHTGNIGVRDQVKQISIDQRTMMNMIQKIVDKDARDLEEELRRKEMREKYFKRFGTVLHVLVSTTWGKLLLGIAAILTAGAGALNLDELVKAVFGN